MKKTSLPWVLILLSWVLFDHTVQGQPQRQGTVFVVNGSGDDTSVSDNLCEIIKTRCLPLAVHTTRWCRWAQLGKDHRDFGTQIVAAEKLAIQVATYHQLFPQEKIYLIGHSAGNHVLLAAMRSLPPKTVDRIILLAPSVSRFHDLRPALRCSRGGIDSFWSTEDQLVSLGSNLFGNADKLAGQPAGEVGFTMMPPQFPEAPLYQNLRQHAWNPGWYTTTGHNGSHYGFTGSCFLDAYVLPLMLRP